MVKFGSAVNTHSYKVHARQWKLLF